MLLFFHTEKTNHMCKHFSLRNKYGGRPFITVGLLKVHKNVGKFLKTFSDMCFCFSGIVKISRKEDEDVMLSCSFKEDLRNKRFDWKKDGKDVLLYEYGEVSPSRQDDQFRQRVSHFPDQLNSGNASIIIKKAKVSDSGNYTCLHIDSEKSYKIELTVGEWFHGTLNV